MTAHHSLRTRRTRISILSLVRQLGVIALSGAILFATFVGLRRYLDDSMFAFILTLVFAISAAPWLLVNDRPGR